MPTISTIRELYQLYVNYINYTPTRSTIRRQDQTLANQGGTHKKQCCSNVYWRIWNFDAAKNCKKNETHQCRRRNTNGVAILGIRLYMAINAYKHLPFKKYRPNIKVCFCMQQGPKATLAYAFDAVCKTSCPTLQPEITGGAGFYSRKHFSRALTSPEKTHG
jgi:hypothetical protein